MQRFVMQGGPGRQVGWLLVFVPGMMLIVLGVLIAIMPELLVALVAGGCILAGLVMTSLGLRLREAGWR